ncbi:MAG: GNAT family N-acetyltransferase [Oscillospiraceae bacterium]|nr:GNAT family N-acetyltransferase [Oscillospiraceae bacterium]
MEIAVCQNPKKHLELLLLADPYEPMIDRYLPQSTVLTAVAAGRVVGIIAFCPVENGAWEIKNLAVEANWQGQGVGRALVQAVKDRLPAGTALLVGTAQTSAGNLIFYEKCGFAYDHTIPNFFTDFYPEPIMEGAEQCVHMIVLRQTIAG